MSILWLAFQRITAPTDLCRECLGAIVACAALVQLAAGPESEVLVPVTMPDGSTIVMELADTTEKRAMGLMFRDALPKDRGMLFTFAEPGYWTFWMKNTRIALDIIWLDRNKQIVHVERNVPACRRTDDGCPQYQPNDEAMYALEIAGGMAEQFKLKRGVKLRFQVPRQSP